MGKPTNWTPEKDVELMRLRAGHMTFNEIALTLGCSISTAQGRWTKISRGETVRYATGRICTWTAEEDAKLNQLRAHDMIFTEIANRIPGKSKSNCCVRWHELNPGQKKLQKQKAKIVSPSISPSLPRTRRMPLHRQLGIETMVYRVPVSDSRARGHYSYMSVTLARV